MKIYITVFRNVVRLREKNGWFTLKVLGAVILWKFISHFWGMMSD